LHLIPDWKRAAGEVLRVLRPDGVFIATRGGRSRTSWHDAVRKYFFKEAGDPPWPPGLDTIDELDANMRIQASRSKSCPT
jgi:hypothetical protein